MALMSSLALSLVTLVSMGASPASAATPTGGNFIATGHDMDFHCSGGSSDECAYFKILVTKARNGSTLPILALDQGTELTIALTNIAAAPVVSLDPTSAAFGTTKFVDTTGKPLYSVIITASDTTCGGCDNTPAGEGKINARASDFTAYFNNGGNIIALTGADNFATYYKFVPLKGVNGTVVSPPFTVTSQGAAIGVTNAMANCCPTHSSFSIPSAPFQTLEKDSAGLAETIACFGCTIGGGGFGGGHNPNIFEVDVKGCSTIHIGYNYFPVGTVINWHVNQGAGTIALGFDHDGRAQGEDNALRGPHARPELEVGASHAHLLQLGYQRSDDPLRRDPRPALLTSSN